MTTQQPAQPGRVNVDPAAALVAVGIKVKADEAAKAASESVWLNEVKLLADKAVALEKLVAMQGSEIKNLKAAAQLPTPEAEVAAPIVN